MKRNKHITLLLVVVLVFATTTSAFAAKTCSGTRKDSYDGFTYSLSGTLNTNNPWYGNPYAYASTYTDYACTQISAQCTVINTDGSVTTSPNAINTSANYVQSNSVTANTFSSSGVKFTGRHECDDAHFSSSWIGYTDYTY